MNVHHASMLDWLATYDGPLFDACVTDPPYHLSSIVKRFGKPGSAEAKVGATGAYARASRGFMGKEWDGGDIAFRPETWAAVFAKMKPGAHLVAFSGTRTYHRMACAIEDAGFEIRDQLAWLYGSGFPKSHDVSKGIDRAAGIERERGVPGPHWDKRGAGNGSPCFGDGIRSKDTALVTAPATPDALAWQGWGTALKPAWEPICLARKPLSEKSIAANVLRWGTGAINVDGCRVGTEPTVTVRSGDSGGNGAFGRDERCGSWVNPPGRFPANLLHDGSDEVLAGFPDTISGAGNKNTGNRNNGLTIGDGLGAGGGDGIGGDSGSAGRFFYSAPRDAPCGLCGLPCMMSPWNASTAETPSPTRAILNANTADGAVLDSPPPESEGKKSVAKRFVRNAASASGPCHLPTASIAADGAPAPPSESLVQNVKSAGNLCDSCATAIAQSLVASKQDQDPASVPFPVSMSEHNAQILRQNLALYVAGREGTDTILTTPSLRQLFGSVSLAIAESTQANDKPESPGSPERSSRFWYSSKAQSRDRLGSAHATVKPVDVMRWLCRLITPPGGLILDPFAGSGTTGIAAMAEGFDCQMIELEADHVADIERKLAFLRGEGRLTFREHDRKRDDAQIHAGPLFGELIA